jgi:hypothetical protein
VVDVHLDRVAAAHGVQAGGRAAHVCVMREKKEQRSSETPKQRKRLEKKKQ